MTPERPRGAPTRASHVKKEDLVVAKQQNILVVDDDPEMRALLLDVLRNDGYDVAEAKDGTEAVLALRARRFDLILMDKNMPGPSGLDLLRIPAGLPGLQVILMTAFGDVPVHGSSREGVPSSTSSSPSG
jgi:CheY-like chemotaxis protein